jgi:hypothetical protein
MNVSIDAFFKRLEALSGRAIAHRSKALSAYRGAQRKRHPKVPFSWSWLY